MVDQLYQEVTNEVAMLKSWNFTQLPGILQSMNIWQQVFGQAGSTYTSTDPGSTLNNQYPSDPSNYANMTDARLPVHAQSTVGIRKRETSLGRKPHRPSESDLFESATDRSARIQSYVEHSNSASGLPPPLCRRAMKKWQRWLHSFKPYRPRKSPMLAPKSSAMRRIRPNKHTPSSSNRQSAAIGRILSSQPARWRMLFPWQVSNHGRARKKGQVILMTAILADFGNGGPDLINDVANLYINAINSAFGLIKGDVAWILNVLIILSIMWS